ncbi:MAG: pyruvate formate lyase family protein [Oscillospiraceae bacterium]
MAEKAYMERINRLKERTLKAVPEIDLEGARILTRGFQETEGEPWVMRKAKAFRKQCEEKTCYILDDELIVGSHASKPRAGALCADASWGILDDEFDTISTRQYDPFLFTDADKKVFLDEIKPYWMGKSGYDFWKKQKPQVCTDLCDDGSLYIDRKIVRAWGDTSPGIQNVVDLGMEGIVAKIKARQSTLDPYNHDDHQKNQYLEAMLVSAEGCCIFGRRYGEEARRLAALEANPSRKAELLEIAEVCETVPAKGAKTFRQAVQSMYLYHCCYFMEQCGSAYSLGRADQYLYPYYKADIEAGRITKEQAQELLDCLWVKFSEACQMNSASSAAVTAGYLPFTNISCGGIDQYGEDAVNEISYMMLDATAEVQMYQPSLSVRYNLAKNSDRFLRAIVDLIKLGTGFPSVHNDFAGMKMMMNRGVPANEAWDWTPGGCVETYLSGKQRCLTGLSDINLGKIVEYALLNGESQKNKRFVTTRTGDPRDFKTYEEFEEAVKEQLRYAVRAVVKGCFVTDDIFEQTRPVPALSLSYLNCIDTCKDYAWGGAKYNCGDGCMFVGVADLVNSCVAIKNLVFDEKKVTMAEMLEALQHDFVGYERIQKLCKDAPKYGNDIPEADQMVSSFFHFAAEYVESFRSHYGKMTTGIIPVTANTAFGNETGALPSGREAGVPLADGISPNCGTDFNGATAVMKSVSHLVPDRFSNGTLLNMKLDPEMLADEHGIAQAMNLLKTMCILGVYHCQFNVVDKEKLLDAQAHPEDYQGMLVRVAGYTAYFVELGKDIQDDIIARTTQKVISSDAR